MAGNEQAFCNSLDVAALGSMNSKDERFIYYEIGVGNGDTMLAADSWLKQRGFNHVIVGVDLPEYTGTARNVNWPIVDGRRLGDESINLNFSGSAAFLSNVGPKANFIFIDGCHGYPCVTRDFLLAEKKIKLGGVICFHDASPTCQGIHFQEHCQMGIDVRNALDVLGLLANTRPGWKKINETWGDQTKGGHGSVFIQRIAE